MQNTKMNIFTLLSAGGKGSRGLIKGFFEAIATKAEPVSIKIYSDYIQPLAKMV